MDFVIDDIEKRLSFIREAGRMKDVARSAFTIDGNKESVAEHTWRVCLLAMTFSDLFGDIDMMRVLQLCVVHDLGEIYEGDVPAIHQEPGDGRKDREHADMKRLAGLLPDQMRDEMLELWLEYEEASSDEAIVAKGLDKLETMITHNQGKNPDSFDYRFNLDYGKVRTDAHPLVAAIRTLIDAETARLAQLHQD